MFFFWQSHVDMVVVILRLPLNHTSLFLTSSNTSIHLVCPPHVRCWSILSQGQYCLHGITHPHTYSASTRRVAKEGHRGSTSYFDQLFIFTVISEQAWTARGILQNTRITNNTYHALHVRNYTKDNFMTWACGGPVWSTPSKSY